MRRSSFLIVGAAFAGSLLMLSCSESEESPRFATQEAACAELKDLAFDGLTTSGRLPNLERRLEALLASSALTPTQRVAVQKLLDVAAGPPPPGEGIEETTDATFGFIDVVTATCP